MLWVSCGLPLLPDNIHFEPTEVYVLLNLGGGYGNKSGGPNSWGSPGGPGQPAYGSAEYWQQYQQYQQQYQQWQVHSQCLKLILNSDIWW